VETNDEDDPRTDAEKRALAEIEKAEKEIAKAAEDLKKGEEDLREAEKDRNVTIVVDGTDYSVRHGSWIVAKLKEHLEIDPAKVLAKITPKGLEDLDDAAEVHIHKNEQFMTHARSGGSS
jgi:hypothetical protein